MEDSLTRIGMFRLEAHESVVSTNDLVKRAIEQGEPEGFAIGARVQTAGYGRQGRAWSSPEGGMYVSVLLRPHVPLAQLPTLSLVAGMAVRDALARIVPVEQAPCIKVKWPNDVVYVAPALTGQAQRAAAAASPGTQSRRADEGSRTEVRFAPAGPSILGTGETLADIGGPAGAAGGGLDVAHQASSARAGLSERLGIAEPADEASRGPLVFRKLVGISLESHAGGVCVGMGVNVRAPREVRAVGGKNTPAYVGDLAAPGGPAPSIEQVRAAVLESFSAYYGQWVQEGFGAFAARYRAVAALDGCVVRIENVDGSRVCEGAVQGVDEWGRLLVLPRGAKLPVTVSSGEVHIAAIE